MTKALICGGRDYVSKGCLFIHLDNLKDELNITKVIQGGARGVDSLAKEWAISRKIPHQEFKADWDKHGKSAGIIRNREMIKFGRPNLIISFLGGKGTQNMISLGLKAGLPIFSVL